MTASYHVPSYLAWQGAPATEAAVGGGGGGERGGGRCRWRLRPGGGLGGSVRGAGGGDEVLRQRDHLREAGLDVEVLRVVGLGGQELLDLGAGGTGRGGRVLARVAELRTGRIRGGRGVVEGRTCASCSLYPARLAAISSTVWGASSAMTRDGGGWVASRCAGGGGPARAIWRLAGLKLAEGHEREVLTAVVVRACPPRTRPTVEARFRPSHHASQARKMFATTSAARAASPRGRARRVAPPLPERSRARRWSTRRRWLPVARRARALRGSSLTPPRTPPRASPRAPRRHRAACVSFPAREAPRRRRPRATVPPPPLPPPPPTPTRTKTTTHPPTCSTCARSTATTTTPRLSPTIPWTTIP